MYIPPIVNLPHLTLRCNYPPLISGSVIKNRNTMKKLLEYLQEEGAKFIRKVTGPNGAFISYTTDSWENSGSVKTLPVGKRSQNGNIAEYNVLITEDGTAIATVNEYETVEELAV